MSVCLCLCIISVSLTRLPPVPRGIMTRLGKETDKCQRKSVEKARFKIQYGIISRTEAKFSMWCCISAKLNVCWTTASLLTFAEVHFVQLKKKFYTFCLTHTDTHTYTHLQKHTHTSARRHSFIFRTIGLKFIRTCNVCELTTYKRWIPTGSVSLSS